MKKPETPKLAIKRETLRTLTDPELRLVAGGAGIRTRRCAC